VVHFRDIVTSKSIKVGASIAFGAVIFVILLWTLICLKDSLAWLCFATGLASGWAAGILLAPYQSEQDRFREYVKIVSSFLAGYVVSKVDRLFELGIDPVHGSPLLTDRFAHRILIAVCSFPLAAVLTYVGRKYVSFGPEAEHPQNSLPNLTP
jgi:hypothetical protein